ncbi:hypothetical protein ACIRS1_07060 [Kitasatospora sp. NPDC101176]|uniref:hypothetical protein n=1 Tax=Kitasatospora sp. NPDC101176 TaxID=3364099 RepID=UPI003811C6E0
MSHDGRVLRGREGLWVYRVLFGVSPQVYGSKLAHVLVEASGWVQVAGRPAARRALLEEAVAAAGVLEVGHPFRAKVLGRALEALAALERQGRQGPQEQRGPQGRQGSQGQCGVVGAAGVAGAGGVVGGCGVIAVQQSVFDD